MNHIFAASRASVLIFTLLLSLGLVLGIADNEKIKLHLNKYMKEVEKEHELAIVPKKENIQDLYTSSRAAPVGGSKTLKDLALQVIAILEQTIVLKSGDPCDFDEQERLDKSFSAILSASNPDQEKIYQEYVNMDISKKKYCNFIENLRCEPVSPGSSSHRCACTAKMTTSAKTKRCVFKRGELCDDRSNFNVFPRWDWLYQKFIVTYPLCEDPYLCSAEKKCVIDEFSKYYAEPTDIAKVLQNILIKANGPPDQTAEILRAILHQLKLPAKKAQYEIVSVEFQAHERLSNHGESCDYSEDRPFQAVMQNYDGKKSPETIRRQFLEELAKVRAPKKICNHFSLLECSSGNTCQCKDGIIRDPATKEKYCSIAHEIQCNGPPPKTFQIYVETLKVLYSGNYAHEDGDIYAFLLTYPPIQPSCVPYLVYFEKQFSISINEPCSVKAHEELFQVLTTTVPGTPEAEQAIKVLVSKSREYCQIRDYTTCSKAGKCDCLPPLTAKGAVCTVPYHLECDVVYKSDYHQKLDQLVPPTTPASNKQLCTSAVGCIYEPFIDKKICSCPPDKYGTECDAVANPHVTGITALNVPDSMKTPKGVQIISELHEALNNLETKFTLNHDDPCDATAHENLQNNTIFFLANVRETCTCTKLDVTWECLTFCDQPEFEISHFEDALKQSRELVSKSPGLCDWNRALRCVNSGVNNNCTCAPEYTVQNKDCFVDLAGRCSAHDVAYHGNRITCRDRTECNMEVKPWPRCESTNKIAKDVCTGLCSDSNDPLLYVEAFHKKIVTYLIDQEKGFANYRTLSEYKECNFDFETKLKNAVQLLIPIPDYAKSTSNDLDLKRKEIRIMEDAFKAVSEVQLGPFVDYCKPGLNCDKDSEKCLPPGATVKPPPPPPPKPGKPSSATQMSKIAYFIVFLVAII